MNRAKRIFTNLLPGSDLPLPHPPLRQLCAKKLVLIHGRQRLLLSMKRRANRARKEDFFLLTFPHKHCSHRFSSLLGRGAEIQSPNKEDELFQPQLV